MRSTTYIILFFMLGFSWMLPLQGRVICFFLLILFYCVDNVVFGEGRVNKLTIIFGAFLLTILTHLAVTNLYELVRFNYVPFHSVYRNSGIRSTLGLIFNTTWIYIIANILLKYARDGLLIRAFASGFNIFTIILLCHLPSLLVDIHGTRLSFVLQEDGHPLNPNLLAYTFMLLLYLNFLASFYTDRILVKAYHWLFCAVNVVFIIMTMSRAIFVALLIGLVCLLFFQRKLFFTLIFVALLFGFYTMVFDKDFLSVLPIPERLIDVNRAIEGGGAGRTDVWMDYFTYASLREYLLGVGYGSSAQEILYQKPLRYWASSASGIISPMLLRILSPHNTYFEAFLKYGIIGLCIYLYLLCFLGKKIIRRAMSESTVSRIYLAIFVSFVLRGMFEDSNIISLMFISLLMSHALQPSNVVLDFSRGDVDEARIDYA